MTMLIVSQLISLVVALFTAWFTVFLRTKYKNKPVVQVRNLLIEALKIFRKYDNYSKAESQFNNEFDSIKKRVFVVALHKLGVPINFSTTNGFDINNISFCNEAIEKNNINLMIEQVGAGMLDNYFYNDVEKYVDEFISIKIRRNIAKRFVSEVATKLSKNDKSFSAKVKDLFSYSERLIISTFVHEITASDLYENNDVVTEKDSLKLIADIDLGLWDYYLMQDFYTFANMKSQIRYMNELAKSEQLARKRIAEEDKLRSIL